jgi:hypothetical protein
MVVFDNPFRRQQALCVTTFWNAMFSLLQLLDEENCIKSMYIEYIHSFFSQPKGFMIVIHEMLLIKKFEKIMQYPLIKFPPFPCGIDFFL